MKTTNKFIALSATILMLCMLVLLAGCGSGSDGEKDVFVQGNDEPEMVTVSGNVLDSEGNPVANEEVTVFSDPVTTTTDREGHFSLNIEAGDHEIEIVMKGEVIYNDTFSCDAVAAFSLGNIASSYYPAPDDPYQDDAEPDPLPSAPENVSASAVDAEAYDYFGFSVAISGDYAIVGAYLEDEKASNAGAVYIYRRTGENTWDTGTNKLYPLCYRRYNAGIQKVQEEVRLSREEFMQEARLMTSLFKLSYQNQGHTSD